MGGLGLPSLRNNDGITLFSVGIGMSVVTEGTTITREGGRPANGGASKVVPFI